MLTSMNRNEYIRYDGDLYCEKDIIGKMMRDSFQKYLDLSEWCILSMLQALRRKDEDELTLLINKFNYTVPCLTSLEYFMQGVQITCCNEGFGRVEIYKNCFYFKANSDWRLYVSIDKVKEEAGATPLYYDMPNIRFNFYPIRSW